MTLLYRQAIRWAEIGRKTVVAGSRRTGRSSCPAPLVTTPTVSTLPLRLFSTSGDEFIMTPDMAAKNLSAYIEKEIISETHPGLSDPENDGSPGEAVDPTEMPEELSELSNDIDRDWRVVAAPGNRMVRMYRKEPVAPGGAKVSISFDVQDGMTEAEEDSEEIEMGEVGSSDMMDGEEEDEEEIPPGVSFTLTVTKAGRSIVCSCVASDAVYVTSVALAELGDNPSTDADEESIIGSQYRGPMFDEIDEDLQDGITDYVRYTCGLSEDTAAFIVMYSDYKEQCEYFNWLQKFQSFVQ